MIPGGDEPHYLAATQSLLHDGDLRVANNYASGEYLEYFPGRLEPHFLKRATSGEIYSIHAPGVSFIVLPAFAVAGYAGAVVDDDSDRGADRGVVLAARVSRVGKCAAPPGPSVIAVFGTAPYFLSHLHDLSGDHRRLSRHRRGAGCCSILSEGRAVSTRVLIAIGSGVGGVAVAAQPVRGARGIARRDRRDQACPSTSLSGKPQSRRLPRFLAVPAIAGRGVVRILLADLGKSEPDGAVRRGHQHVSVVHPARTDRPAVRSAVRRVDDGADLPDRGCRSLSSCSSASRD